MHHSLRCHGLRSFFGSLVFPGVQNCDNINKLCLHVHVLKCCEEYQAMRKTFEIPLDIPDVTIQTVETDRHSDFVITVKSTVECTSCHTCGKKITKVYGEDREITLRHLPILGRKTYIRLRPVRYQCPYCDGHPTTTQQLSWYTPKSAYTKAYEEHILLKLVNSTVQDVCLKEAIGYEAIMGIIDRHIQGEVDWNQFARLDILGLDEISLKKAIEILWPLSQDVLTIRQSSWGCYQIAKRARSRCFSLVYRGSFARRSRLFVPICMTALFTQHKRSSANGSKSSLIAFM
jgi:hypothetical protein